MLSGSTRQRKRFCWWRTWPGASPSTSPWSGEDQMRGRGMKEELDFCRV